MRIPDGGKGLRLLDVGCGTGASTAALLAAAPHAEIVAVDASGGMLAQARAKSWPSSVTFVHSRIEDLADAGVSGPFDGILAAYLVRNLDDKDATAAQVSRTPEAGGEPLPCTNTRCATPSSPPRCGTRCAPRLSSPAVGCAPATPRSTRYLRRSVNHVRRRASFPEQDAGQRFRRCSQRDDARLAAQHRAHVPRAGPAMSDPRASRSSCATRCGSTRLRYRNNPRVVVVGAGIAGLAAATGLAERGVAVELIERQPYLGGGSADGPSGSSTAPTSR